MKFRHEKTTVLGAANSEDFRILARTRIDTAHECDGQTDRRTDV